MIMIKKMDVWAFRKDIMGEWNKKNEKSAGNKVIPTG